MVFGAPASRVANTPGWPSVGTRVTFSKPASRASRIMSSHPSAMPRFSAAIEGWRTHRCSRCTPSSWRLTISAWMASWPSPAASEMRGRARTAAEDTAVPRKSRREYGGMTKV